MKYAPYPEYRDSGVEWMGKVPKHWEVLPARVAVANAAEKNDGAINQDYLSLVAGRGVIPYADKGDMGNKKPDDLAKCKLVKKGNIVLNSMNFFIGSYGLSEYDGVCSPVYIVLDVNADRMLRRFALRVFGNAGFQVYLATFGDGILKHRAAIGWDDIKANRLPVPPLDEQQKLSEFLDYETAKIDALIEKQQQLIALLKEKRQAVISHAVTKGLNPDAPMRDSGVEWLGKVPAHWKVHFLRYCAADGHKTFTDGDWVETPFITERGVRLLQTGNVGIGVFKEQGFRYISEASFSYLNCTEIYPHDVLICRLDGPVGRACLVPELGVQMITSVDNTIVKTNDNFDPRFLVYMMTSTQWLSWIENICRAGGGFRFRISRTMLGNQLIPAPPLEEQKRIADKLDNERERYQKLVERSEEAVEILSERRAALISAAVTGKIDVRDWKPPVAD